MRLPGTLLLLASAGCALAGEPTPPPQAAMAEVKQDLESLKAPTAGTDSASLPSLDLKDLGPVPSSPAPVAPAPEKEPSVENARKKSGTGNWLVDAMDRRAEEDKAARGSGRDARASGERALPRLDEREGGGDERELAAVPDSREAAASRAPEKVYNPLDAFLAGWLSPRDHDLLASSRGESDPAHPRADLLPGLEVSAPAAEALGLTQEAPAAHEASAAANPYLATIDWLEPQARTFPLGEFPGTAPLSSDAMRAWTPTAEGARAPDVQRSFVPDFAQPSDDDKYFKQLKRF